MRITSFPQMEELAKETVLYAMKHHMDADCFFSRQGRHTIFYKVYDDIAKYNMTLASAFLIHLENAYEIEIAI